MTVAIAAGLVAGCGQSQQEKATAQVCTARDDIAKHVDQLQGMTLTSATTSQIKDSLKAIQNDMSTIVDAQGDLSDDRRQDVQAANDQFRTSVRQTVQSVGSTVSVDAAKNQLQQAFQQLATTYRSTFGKIDCA